MLRRIQSAFIGLAVILIASLAPGAAHAEEKGQLNCKMSFSMKGWSAIYKTSSGSGTIHCENGASIRVAIKLTGGGLTFGKTEIKDGTGKFSPVSKIDDLLGSYAQAEAEAGAVKSAEAQVLTKGEVSLALSGTGEGWSLGVSGAKFTISKK